MVNSPPYTTIISLVIQEEVLDIEQLTARTLSNDVFPAFCSPIIVISISVALREISWSGLDV